MTAKTPLAPTAAYVLRLGMDVYKEPLTQKYLTSVDMSSGDALYKVDSTSTCVMNRKFYIRQKLLEILKDSPIPIQLLVIAAGVDPMPLEMLSLVSEKIAHVFEVDVAFMPEKQKLYQSIAPEFSDRISCITLDVTSPNLAVELQKNHGFSSRIPVYLQMEGITYYITAKNIQTLLQQFGSRDGSNHMLADYLLPYDQISPLGKSNGERIFGSITHHTGFANIAHYSLNDFQHILTQIGGSIIDSKTSYVLEGLRTGKHEAIQKPEDGICELLTATF